MADEATTVIRLASWLGQALGESAPLFADFSTENLGIDLPDAVLQAPPVKSAAQQAQAAATKVNGAAREVDTAAASKDDLQILAALLKFGAALGDFFVTLGKLAGSVSAAITPVSVPDAASRAAAHTFAGELAKRIGDYAISSAITDRLPHVAAALKVFGLLDWQNEQRDPAKPLSRVHVRKGLRLDRIKGLISNPGQHFIDTIGWGSATFDPTDFFNLVREFYQEESSAEVGVEAGDPYFKACTLVRRDRTVNPPGLFLSLFGDFTTERHDRVTFNDNWGVGVDTTLHLEGGVSGRLTPPLNLSLQPLNGQITGELRAYFDRNPSARPFDIVGGTGLLTISANDAKMGMGLKANWNGTAAKIDPLLFVDVDGLTLKIGSDNADSFIGSLLASADIQGQFDLGLEWQGSSGLKVKASGGVEIAIPIHRQLGPIEIETVYLALRIKNDGTLALEVSTALQGSLGPLSASVDRIGATLDLRLASGTDARFGPFDLDLGFKPPNGVGLSVDAGIVKGGGYLYIDTDRGEYAGALQLMFSGVIALNAVGIISTRMPDGSSGFSLLIIITAEFGTGIQLGFGFTLLAVGGLLGLNRTMKLQPLMDGVRSDAIESVMFPHDVVANAPRIISDLRKFFPPQEGIFLIGPMAKLGWGTPTLVSVALGIIIEIPGNIAILGVLKIALPDDDVALLKLQVNFAGAIEFDKKRLYFFAALFDSHVLFLTIEGEMGLLVAFGDDANFVVSVGGFHPSFPPPPLPFPSPRRVAVSLINTDVARVRVEGYFAVTSNTAQFGAAVEVYFGFSAFNIQGHLAFDALFQFSPFHFVISISASFSLTAFGVGLLSVSISGSLEGPAPWRVHGTGSVSILFFSISADFDVTWGESNNTTLPPIEVMPLFKGELEKAENWRALLPPANNLLVTLRKLPDDQTLVLHPIGVLRIAQRALPLDITLDTVGNQKPSDVNNLSIAVTGGGLARKADAFEQFAPAQYQNFSDSEKLSRPAFAPEHAGLELSSAGADFASSRMVKRIIRYEEIILDSNARRFARSFFNYAASLFTFFLRGGAVTKCALSDASKTRLDPFEEKIAVSSETFTVALQANNKAYSSSAASFHSEASARQFLSREVAKDPNLAGSLHVIPSFERAA